MMKNDLKTIRYALLKNSQVGCLSKVIVLEKLVDISFWKMNKFLILYLEVRKPWIFPKIPHVSRKIETKSLEMHVVK